MRRHGRTFRRDLETDMADNAATANWWGLSVVVALAVGRESAETVVFLYGLGAQYTSAWSFLQVLALGIGAAWLTFWALQQGSRFFSWRTFFRVSEILLLLLAAHCSYRRSKK
jgi:high-affinity iron transporter